MLPKSRRLKKNTDFQLTLNTGSKKRIGDLLFFFRACEQECVRFGIVVSKRVSKSAVVRNRIRRVLSNIVHQNLINWGDRPKGDLVVLALGLPKEPFHETLMSSWIKWLNE